MSKGSSVARGLRLSAIVLVTSTVGCGTKYVTTKTPDAHLVASQSAADVRAAIIRALASEHHSAESEAAGRIFARLGKGDRYARVAIDYSDTQYVVRYLDSTLRTKRGLDGEVLVEKRFASMANHFEEAIASELQRPARELAEAERNRQQYFLLLQQSRTAQAEAEANAAWMAAQPAPEPAVYGDVVQAAAPQIESQIPTVEYNTSVRRSDQSLTCCINGARYTCPSQEAFRACFQSGPAQCTPAGRCK